MAGEENKIDQGDVGSNSLLGGFSSPGYGLAGAPSGAQLQSQLPAAQISGATTPPPAFPMSVGKTWATLPYGGRRFAKYYTQHSNDSNGGMLNLNFSPPAGYVGVIQGISLFITASSGTVDYMRWFPVSAPNNPLWYCVPLINGSSLKALPQLPVFTKTVTTFIPLLDTDVFDINLVTVGPGNDAVFAYVKIEGAYLLSRGLPADLEVTL